MTYECKIETIEARPVLAIRTRTPVTELPQALGRCLGAIAGFLGAQGMAPAGAPYAAYFNMDMNDLDIEIGFPVAQPVPGQNEIQAGELMSGQAATCLHTGPYTGIENAYNALGEFMAEAGHQPAGVSYEFYLNDPQELPPEQLETRIVFMLAS